MTRLRKKLAYEYNNPNSSMYFPNDWDQIENDNINYKQYGNTLNKEWTFEQTIDYPQYELMNDNSQTNR